MNYELNKVLIDLHSHRPSPDAIVNIDLDADLLTSQPDGMLFSAGVHPWATADTAAALRQLAWLQSVAADGRVVAIGEAGIDHLRGGDIEFQKEIFLSQVGLSEALRKPMIIHSVRGDAEIIAARRQSRATMPWVIHGFRGGKEQAQMLIREGFYLSFGERFNPEALRATPAERLLVETDESPLTILDIASKIADARYAQSQPPAPEISLLLILNCAELNIRKILTPNP